MALLTGLVSYYKLDEASGNAADSVGANTLTNNNTVAYNAGLINNAADFGTANTNKSLARTSIITGGNIAIAAWVKLNTAITASPSIYGIFEQEDDTAFRIFNMYYTYNGGTPQINADYHKNNTTDLIITSNLTLSTTIWSLLGLDYDGTTFRMWVNGVLTGTPITTSGGGSGSVSGNEFSLGVAPRFGGSYGSLKMDAVGVWSRNLTSAEWLEYYNGGAGIQYPFIKGNALFLAGD